MPVSDITAAEQRLAWLVAGGILVISAIGSGAGAFLAGRIGRPLADLTDAAAGLSRGDLSSPVAVEARVREVTLVAQALEGARADLGRTLEQLRQEKAWSEHLLEAIVEGIVTLDSGGRIRFFSQGAERITGWTREEAIGLNSDRLFLPVETQETFSRLIPAPGRRETIVVELRDGRQATLAVTRAQLLPPEGGDAQVALVFRDVSEAEAVHRLLGHFRANVAHEFRTPLAAVAASVELLIDQAPDAIGWSQTMREQLEISGATEIRRPDDERLAQQIRRALEEIGASGSPLHIQVRDGVVTLRGIVATYLARAQILLTVRSVPGVLHVIDSLWV